MTRYGQPITNHPRGTIMTWGNDWQQPPAQPANHRPGWRRKRILFPAGAVGAFILIGAIGSAVDPVTKTKSTTAAAASATPSASPITATEKPASSEKASPTTAPTAKKAQAAGDQLPNLIGMGLQAAQDAAQAAGFYGLTSHDSLGRARHQILDRDWKVCSQTPAAGQHDTGATVDLGAVKLAESCPAKDQTAPRAAGTTMPNFAGKSVKAARAALDSSTSITVKDASADDRGVWIESNWKVCTQSPKPGAALNGQPVTFAAVKFEETCP
jgi:hypothetical protein